MEQDTLLVNCGGSGQQQIEHNTWQFPTQSWNCNVIRLSALLSH